MEGITWVRMAAIAALFFGSLYVLAPTMLQGDIEAQRRATTEGVSTPSASTKVDLRVRFEGENLDAAVPVVQKRLKGAGLSVARVRVEEGQLVVTLKPGTSEAAVVQAVQTPGVVRLYSADAIASLPAVLPPALDAAPHDPKVFAALSGLGEARSHWASVANTWGLEAVPGTAVPLPVRVDGLVGNVITLDQPLPEGTSFAVVAVDGKMVGLAVPGVGGISFTPLTKEIARSTNREYLSDPAAIALIEGGPLSGALRHVAVEEVVQEARGPATEVEPTVPAWVLAMLPNTAINLGLDLQGGLDITLQVELDDAVMSQVARDATAMREQAKDEKVTFETVRKDKHDPAIWWAGADADTVSTFLRKRYPEYIIAETTAEGVSFRMTDTRIEEVQTQAVDQVLETLRKRVDATGVKEPSIVKKSGGRINVQLPGAADLQGAINAIGKTAILQFRMVDPKQDASVLRDILGRAQDELAASGHWEDDNLVNEWLWENNLLDRDRIILWHYKEGEGGMKRIDFSVDGEEGPLLLMNEVVLSGNDVNSASVGFDQNNMAYVGLNFKPRGGQIFCDLTTTHVKERFAIILDNQIRSAPSIREKICGGRASIDMGSSLNALDDANNLSLVLRTGSLDAPVSIGEVRQVGASLGQDSIRSGSLASTLGGFIVLVFMGFWYKTSGMIANVALVLNVILVVASLAIFGATLTLPGIAGIALTVGMAVDANIIIFERIREELATGVHPRKAVDSGFDKGLSAVLDANITTAIAGVVLFSYGTGPIKGFAVTLLIGIVTTLVTALFVTRTLMELYTRRSNARISI